MEHGNGQANGLAISALVLGIVGVVLNLIPIFPYLLGILAIVFGIMGRKMENGKGMALAGIILGTITLAMKILFWSFFFVVGGVS